MAIVFQLTLGLLLLASFVACYFSSKYWHWSHVLLTETVFLLSLAFLILAGEVFRIQGVYGKKNEQNLAQIERIKPQVEALRFGTDNQGVINQLEGAEVPVQREATEGEDEAGRMLSVRDLDHELGMVSRTRGRVWRDVELAGVDQQSQTVRLSIPVPRPHSIATDSILYAFQQGEPTPQGEPGPQYLGEFRVTNSAEAGIEVQPTASLDERTAARLQNAGARWTLYETMPVDQHPDGELEILAGTPDEKLRALLPESSVEEYIRHGKEVQPGDDQWHKTGYDENGDLVPPDEWDASTEFVYRRSLRDYNLLFQEYSKRYSQMEADYNALTEDNKQLEQALANAREVLQVHQTRQAKLEQDLAGVQRSRQAIEAHQSQVDTQLSNAQGLLGELVENNRELAGQLGSSAQ